MDLNATQVKMFRSALDWTQDRLAEVVGISAQTIRALERGKTIKSDFVNNIILVMDAHGYVPTSAGGIEPKQDKIDTYIGVQEFPKFWDDVYVTCKANPREIVCCNVDEDLITLNLGSYSKLHIDRMDALQNIYFRCTIKRGDRVQPAKYGEYRWSEFFGSATYYCYGDKLALMTLKGSDVKVMVIDNKDFADSYREQFDVIWRGAEVIQ